MSRCCFRSEFGKSVEVWRRWKRIVQKSECLLGNFLSFSKCNDYLHSEEILSFSIFEFSNKFKNSLRKIKNLEST